MANPQHLELLRQGGANTWNTKNLSASFFTVSSTLSFTLYKYYASKEQKCFFEDGM